MMQEFVLEQKTENSPTRPRQWWMYVKEALLPPLCFCCSSELAPFSTALLCSSCSLSLSPSWHTICPVCEKEKTFSGYASCAHMSSSLSTASYLFPYSQKPARALLHGLKYSHAYHALLPFITPLEKERLNLLRISADIIVPIPLHPRRERERGYNQASLIAHSVATLISLPVDEDVLKRVRSGRPQMKTPRRRERIRNTRGLFKVSNPETVSGKSILLVDDIMTTGATLTEAAFILLSAGAVRVHGFVLAREE